MTRAAKGRPMYTDTCTHTDPCTHRHMHTHRPVYTQTHAHTQTCLHRHMHTHRLVYTDTCTHTPGGINLGFRLDRWVLLKAVSASACPSLCESVCAHNVDLQL